MKANYMKPEVAILTLNAECNLMAGSVTGQRVYTEEEAGTDVVGLSRQSTSVWGDDEEEY